MFDGLTISDASSANRCQSFLCCVDREVMMRARANNDLAIGFRRLDRRSQALSGLRIAMEQH
jgi:hypothetical protein